MSFLKIERITSFKKTDLSHYPKALFAIGNIAFDTAKSEEWEFVKLLPILQLCDSSYNRLFDDNEKVRGRFHGFPSKIS